ncbi:electron transfer flavoprotein subunit beta [Isoptericola sp. b515]|uniref:electron transfer flavoprotein subunit beta/FixA family protein n=1 Tax=Isoptericola sp. b515 TaxID=3064652 RepID=UPI0027138170|nr:electron transfer flavoprotein subunit beta [Isoptericola sp. b515]MDO8148890.1 electron transfer flavoprotein subunit beta [Isoptericola sp. b515]
MKIAVLVKVVPDTYVDRTLSLETGLADRATADLVLDEIDERALEVALRHADDHPDTEIVAVAMTPEAGVTSLRKALALGATSALQVVDERLVGADVVLTAEILAAAVQHVGFDVVLAGDASTDGSGGAVPAAVAELLAVPAATALSEVHLSDTEVTGVRASDGAAVRVGAPLPAVVSVTEALPEVRLAGFKGIIAAKKKTINTVSAADLGVDPEPVDAARSIMIAVSERPPRTAGTKIVDSGDAAERLADFLVENRLA